MDRLQDSFDEAPSAQTTQPVAPVVEVAPPPELAAPPPIPTSVPMCWSFQHPSKKLWRRRLLGCVDGLHVGADGGIAGGVVGSGGGAASSSTGVAGGVVFAGVLASSSRTEVVVEDDPSGDDEPITTVPPASASASATRPPIGGIENCSGSPLKFWMRRIGARMVEADAFVRGSGDRLDWDLTPPGQNIVDWAIAYIQNVLARAWVKAFYVGLTSSLRQRWLGEDSPSHGRARMEGHKVKGWQRMTLLAVSDLPDVIGDAEKAVIAKFRRWGQHGFFNEEGHPLCANRNPGGEGARAGVPPHLLYVCFSWNCSNASLGIFD